MQAQQLHREMWALRPSEFHHGLCIGADEAAHHLAKLCSFRIIGHPPTETKWMMGLEPSEFAELRNPRAYLVRNGAIVDETDALLATPAGPEDRRSGTWSTIRLARRGLKPVTVIMPSGDVIRYDPSVPATTSGAATLSRLRLDPNLRMGMRARLARRGVDNVMSRELLQVLGAGRMTTGELAAALGVPGHQVHNKMRPLLASGRVRYRTAKHASGWVNYWWAITPPDSSVGTGRPA